MEKQNKIILGLVILLTFVIVAICVYSVKNHKGVETTDAIKFKEEYESLNGLENEINGRVYPTVNINSDNPMVYKTSDEILKILKNKTPVVYFGFEKCPWCRSMIETLISAAKDNSIASIYYVNIYDIRDAYELDENNKIKKIKEGTKTYQEILEFLGDNLEPYYLKDDEGNEHDTKTTRLYAPTVVAVKDGEVKSIHEVTVDSQEDPYTELSEDQKEELYNIYDNLIDSLDNESCETSNAC